jgi:hypothetical protein
MSLLCLVLMVLEKKRPLSISHLRHGLPAGSPLKIGSAGRHRYKAPSIEKCDYWQH